MLAIVFFLLFLVYFPSLFLPFLHDDFSFIIKNPQIANFDFVSIFGKTASPDGNAFVNAYYRPILEWIYRIEYSLFHGNPFGYHAVNIFLHGLNVFLVFQLSGLLFLRYRGSFSFSPREISLFIALVFALHPVQAEAVNCIVGISNLVCALFVLLSVQLFLMYWERQGSSPYVLWASMVFCFLGLLAKEQAVIIPFLTGLYFLLFAGKRSNLEGSGRQHGMWITVALYFFVTFIYFVIRRIAVGSTGVPLSFDYEFWLRMLSIPRTVVMYLRILIVPFDLHYYRNTDILQVAWPGVISLLAVAVLIAVRIRQMDLTLRRLALLACGWFGIFLLPVLNIVPMINEYSFVLTADHFLYLPVFAFTLLVIVFILKRNLILSEPRQKIVFWGCGVFFCFLSLLTWNQHSFYRSEVALFEHTLRYEPQFGRGHILLGKSYYIQGSYHKAIEENEKAIKIMMRYVELVKDLPIKGFYLGMLKGCYFDKAHSYEALGDFSSALNSYKKALEIDSQDHVLYNNLGVVYVKMGQIDKAIDSFEQSLRLQPNEMAQQNLFHSRKFIEQTR